MASNTGAGTMPNAWAQSDIEIYLDESSSQLSFQHHQTQTVDALVDTEDALLVDSDLKGAEATEPWQVLRPTDIATAGYTRPDSSESEDMLHLTEFAFKRVARGDVGLLEKCLDAGAITEFENHHGLTLLVTAIKKSDIAITRLLLQKGADVQHRVEGKPPLFHAVQNQEHGPALIRLLLDYGANINTTCGLQCMNALHWAAAAGMVDSADYLLSRGIDIEATCAGEHTALHVAAGTGHLMIVKLLLAQGAELGKRGGLGGNAMTFAASMGHLDIVALCVEEGLPIDDCNDQGLTALLCACDLGHIEVAKFLLEKGADVNQADSRQSTPLLDAAAKGHLEIVQTLINTNADLSFVNSKGQNALEIAMSKGHAGVVRLILTSRGGVNYPLESVSLEIASARRLETIRALLKSASLMYEPTEPAGDISATCAWVKGVLDTGGDLVRPQAISNMIVIAIADANVALIEALLSVGADPNEFSLSTAVVNGNREIVRLLLDHGAGPVSSPRCIEVPDGHTRNVLEDVLLNMSYESESCLANLQMLLGSGRFDVLHGTSSTQTAFWRVLDSKEWETELRDQVAYMMLDSLTNIEWVCNGDGGSVLHHIVQHGREDMAVYALDRGATIDHQDHEGRTPLVLACEFKPQMIKFLLDRGADPNVRYGDGRGPFHAAATAGNIEALTELCNLDLAEQSLGQRSKNGWTPLACALAADQEDAALFLIERGADLRHTVAENGRSMLHLAAAFGHERVIEKIVNSAGIDVDAKDIIKDSTPLLLACAGTRYKAGSTKVVCALLAAGADIEAAGSHLDRPLHVSISTGNAAIARLLIEHGADIDATGSKGRTSLHLAAQSEYPDIMRLLLSRGAAIEVQDDSGFAPLHMCTRSIEAQMLIDYGARIDVVDKDGLAPMHHAVQYGDLELFATLKRNGASPQIRTSIDGRNVADMLEDLADVGLSSKFHAILESPR